MPSDLARRTRPVWQYRTAPALSALLLPSPASPGSSCAQLPPGRCDGQAGRSPTPLGYPRLTAHRRFRGAPHLPQAGRGYQYSAIISITPTMLSLNASSSPDGGPGLQNGSGTDLMNLVAVEEILADLKAGHVADARVLRSSPGQSSSPTPRRARGRLAVPPAAAVTAATRMPRPTSAPRAQPAATTSRSHRRHPAMVPTDRPRRPPVSNTLKGGRRAAICRCARRTIMSLNAVTGRYGRWISFRRAVPISAPFDDVVVGQSLNP